MFAVDGTVWKAEGRAGGGQIENSEIFIRGNQDGRD